MENYPNCRFGKGLRINMLSLCTLALVCDLCDVDTIAALGATSTFTKMAARKALKDRAACASTHADKPDRWQWGFMRMYKNGTTKQYVRRLVSRTGMPMPPDGEWKMVDVLAFRCMYCEDLHFLQRDGSWKHNGMIEDEGFMRNKNLDHFPGIEHPGTLMIPRMTSILAGGGMYPVQQ